MVDEGLRGIAFDESGTNGWVVGKGKAVHVVESVVGDPVSLPAALNAVTIAETEAWAVGSKGYPPRGVIYRYRDGRWSEDYVHHTEWSALHAVSLRGSSEVWAVGDGGTVLRLDGTQWSEIQVPLAASWRAVMIVDDDVWVAGGKFRDFNGRNGRAQLLRLAGDVWSIVYDGPEASLVDLVHCGVTSALSADGTVFQHVDGTTVEKVASIRADYTTKAVAFVSMTGCDEMLVARADGQLFAVDVASSSVTKLNYLGDIRSVGFTETEGWAVGVGAALSCSDCATGYWRRSMDGDPLVGALDMWLSTQGADTQGWAVGIGGATWKYTSGRWVEAETAEGVGDLLGVSASSSDGLAWAIGANDVYRGSMTPPFTVNRYDGAEWKTVWSRGASGTAFYDVEVLDGGDVWVAAADGVWRGDDAGRFQRVLGPIQTMSIEAGARSDVWVGARGSVYRLHTENGACERMPLPTTDLVYDILDTGDHVWAGASSGYVLSYDDSMWTVVRGPTEPTGQWAIPSEILALGASGQIEPRIWAAGADGTVLSIAHDDLIRQPRITPATPVVPPPGPTVSAHESESAVQSSHVPCLNIEGTVAMLYLPNLSHAAIGQR